MEPGLQFPRTGVSRSRRPDEKHPEPARVAHQPRRRRGRRRARRQTHARQPRRRRERQPRLQRRTPRARPAVSCSRTSSRAACSWCRRRLWSAARFPVVDVHTHPTFRTRSVAGVPHGEEVRVNATAAELLAIMDRRNLRTIVNLTGGVGAGLRRERPHTAAAAPGQVRRVHRAVVRPHRGAGLRTMAGGGARARKGRGGTRPQGAQDAGTVPS